MSPADPPNPKALPPETREPEVPAAGNAVAKTSREARLAEALRANLRRRKGKG